MQRASRTVDAEEGSHVRAVGGGAAGDGAGGELHGPGEVLFDLIEAAVAVDHRGDSAVTRRALRR